MDNFWNLRRRLADVSNTDLDNSCKYKRIDFLKSRETPRCIVLTASGFHGAAKQELQRLAASIGATYSGDLVLGTTTHLICKRLIDCFGTAKYQRALQWGIHVVTYDWLQASSAAGKPLPEQNYKDDQPQSLQPSPKPEKRQQQKAHFDCKQQTAESKITQQSACEEPNATAAGQRTNQQRGCGTPAAAAQQQMQKQEQQQQHPPSLLQQTQPTPQRLLLNDLPDDFLLQGSEPEDVLTDPAEHDAGGAGIAFSLSQYSVQQQQEYDSKQHHLTAELDNDKLNRHQHGAAGDAVFGFGQLTATATEQTSPCMQHFVPMHHQQQQQQQQELLLTVSDVLRVDATGSELQPEGISIVQPNLAAAAAAMSPALHQRSVSSTTALARSQGSESSLSVPAAAAVVDGGGYPVNAFSLVTSATPADEDASGDSPIGLLIPETQAELEDPWVAAAGGGDTPVSLKYYASQQRSRRHTAAAPMSGVPVMAGVMWGGAALGHVPAAAAAIDPKQQQQQQQEEDFQDSGADETEDETAEISAASLEEPGAIDEDSLQDDSVARPWSSSSSTAHAQQQQQQPEFRLTQPSGGVSDSSRCSSGLSRLRRRDGYKRRGRVLLSELPDPSDNELQDSDCEGDRENRCEHDCEVKGQQGTGDNAGEPCGNDILEDSDCEDLQGTRAADVQQQQQQQLRVHDSHMKAATVVKQKAAAVIRPNSPVHSCTASSLPALSSDEAASSVGRKTTSSSGITSPNATTIDTPAASAVSGSSAVEMPVMRLKFSLSNTTDITAGVEQQDDSAYTPSCSYMSSECSPCSDTEEDDCSAGSGGQQHQTPEEEEEEKHMQQQKQKHKAGACSSGKSPLSDPSTFITRRRGGRAPGTPQHQHQQHQQQQQRQEQVPSAASLLGQVFVKQEPEAISAEQWQHEQQHCLPAEANPADAMLRALKQQQQQRQHANLKPAPIKQERLTPADHLLQDLRQRQQQQQIQQQAKAASSAADEFDDDADSQRADPHHLQQQQQQQQRLPRNSVSSSATDVSTMSRKVPLRVVGSCEKIISGETVTADGLPGSTTPLERLLQATLATRRDSGAATAGIAAAAVKQEQVDWLHTPEGDASKAADTAIAAAAAAAGAESEDDAFEITELPTKIVAARNKAMTKQLGAHLAHLSQASGDQVIPLKLLAKAPRSSTAKAFHGLRNSSKLVFADQVQIPWAHATISTKEKSRCVIVADKVATAAAGPGTAAAAASAGGSGAAAAHSDDQQEEKVFVAEPVAFYKLETGEWWLELLRFHSTKELRLLAKAAECKLHLPADFQLSYELLRGMTHEHVPMRRVQGEFKLSKVKKVPSSSRSRSNPFFWRYSIDTATCQVLTDRPVTDYVVH